MDVVTGDPDVFPETSPRFEGFNATDLVYKVVNKHELKATLLVPKNAKPGVCPVLVHWHGGGFIIGDRMFEPWFAKWLVQLAQTHTAIIITPDYRLLPESTMTDILADLSDFYHWLHTTFPTLLASLSPETTPNLIGIAVAGESAGGYLALQTALQCPHARAAVAISEFGAVDLAHARFSAGGPKPGAFAGAPACGAEVVEEYVRGIEPGAVRTVTRPPALWHLTVAVGLHGLYPRFVGERAEEVYLMRAVEGARGKGGLPALWVVHGMEDSIVPVQMSETFVERVRALHPDTPLLLTLQPGEHGFDAECTLETDWVKDGLEFVKKYWP